MVEVTRANFEALLPEIAEKIHSGTFVAVDAEYTGIYSEDLSSSVKLFDTGPERYVKARDTISKFVICQFGLAIFKRNPAFNKNSTTYNVDAYKFYLFPVAFESFAKRELLTCQVSCINFLTRHDFDFNKFFKDGIPYLNKEKSESLRSFLKANRHVLHTAENLDKSYFPMDAQILADEDIEEIIGRLAGFSKVIDVISEAGIPVIGHNFFNDLLFTYQQFFANLPVSYEEFKATVHELFPVIYDTKHLAREVQKVKRNFDIKDNLLSDTNLFALYTSSHSAGRGVYLPIIELNGEANELYSKALFIGRTQNLETVPNNSCHSADFDAIITGCVFLNICNMACSPLLSVKLEYPKQLPPTFSELIGKTEDWSNQIQIARAVIPFINIAGPDPQSHRPNWIIVKSDNPGKLIDPVNMKLELVKYGDLEIDPVNETEVVIACGSKGCQRKVWQDLLKKGFSLTEQNVASPRYLGKWWNRNRTTPYIGLSVCGALLAFLLMKLVRWIADI